MAKLEHQPKSTAPATHLPAAFAPVRDLIQSQPAAFVAASGDPLFVVGTNVQLFADPHARADLLAIDPAGTAVIVVVERDGEHWLLEHGLMCAGMVAGWKPEFFSRYPGVVSEDLQAFLHVPGEQINRKQRVVLVAHAHDYAVFSAAGWLAERHGMEILCLRGEIDPGSGRLNLAQASAAEAAQEPRVEIEPVVFPPSPPTVYRERYLDRDPGQPHAPLLDPVTKTATNVHRLQVLWRPEPEAVAAYSIEERVEQIIREEIAPPIDEVPAPRLQIVEMPVERPAAASEPAPEANPEPKPPASERAGAENFRLAALLLAGIALAAAAVLILSLRPLPAPQEQQAQPQPVAAPQTAPANTGEQGSLQQTTEPAAPPATFRGVVTDQATGRPIPHARIYYAGQGLTADDAGRFELTPAKDETRVFIKASGYRQTEAVAGSQEPIRLKPIEIHAFYLSHAHVADKARREQILRLIRATSANAVVLGVKDVTGQVNVAVDSPLAAEIGSTAKAAGIQLARQVALWKNEGIYTIGLLTLFKDDLVAKRRPEFALRSLESHRVIKDPDGISWTNPAVAEVRDYNVAVAKAAAAAGFDEIQFDFTRFPAEPLSQEGGGPVEYQRRLETIVDFLSRAKAALAPYNVYVGSSVFGSVCTLQRAGVIGQKMEEFAEHLDYVSPMLYPSYFEPVAKYPIPLKNGYRLVYDNLLRAVNRLHGENLRLRPWLQNFPDRSSPNVPLNIDEIHGQIKAVADARASGWMLWDARNQYLNTSEAVQRLNGQIAENNTATVKDSESDSEDGDAAMPERPKAAQKTELLTSGLTFTSARTNPPPPSTGAGMRFSVVILLLLAAGCLAVLYGSARAAWLFRQWTQRRQTASPVAQGPVRARWLPRPELVWRLFAG